MAAHAVTELATTLGLSARAGQSLVQDAVELGHRLPRLWARVLAYEVPCWRARRVAEATAGLPGAAADFVDRHVAAAAVALPAWQLDSVVREALVRFDPERHRAEGMARTDRRGIEIALDRTTLGGLTPVHGELELPDALDLDAAVRHAATQLETWGATGTEGARRARAVGEIARQHLTWHDQERVGGSVVQVESQETGRAQVTVLGSGACLAQQDGPDDDDDDDAGGGKDDDDDDVVEIGEAVDGGAAGAGSRRRPRDPRRQVVLYLHMAASEIEPGQGRVDALGRVENTRSPVDVDAIRRWCGASGTRVVVRPVLDLAGEMRVDSYEIPDRMREQVILRDSTCLHPYCTRPARACDVDHVVPFDHDDPSRGGPTASSNLVALCRRHHNDKTDRHWSYRVRAPGVVEWRSARGDTYERDARGTRYLGRTGVLGSTGGDPDPP